VPAPAAPTAPAAVARPAAPAPNKAAARGRERAAIWI
jgi:hypothetical protein